jgi:hypothetical protein
MIKKKWARKIRGTYSCILSPHSSGWKLTDGQIFSPVQSLHMQVQNQRVRYSSFCVYNNYALGKLQLLLK